MMGRVTIDIRSTEYNNMAAITVSGYQNLRTEFRSMLLKCRVQEPDGNPGQDSGSLCVLLGRIGEVDHDPRHKVTLPLDSRLLVELSVTSPCG